MNLATRIQHHASRAALLDDLLPRLTGLDPVVVPDPDGPKRSTWRAHRACLEAIPEEASHLLVIQDDAWPCDRFADAVQAALAERPDRIVCLFVPGVGHLVRRIRQAQMARERWLEFPATSFVPTVAVIYPAEHAREIPAFCDRKKIPVSRADDAVVSTYTRSHRVPVAATLPSLVQHRDEVESIMRMPSGNGHAHRLAAWYEETPVLTVV